MMTQQQMLDFVQEKTKEIFGIDYTSEIRVVSDLTLRGLGISLGYMSAVLPNTLQIAYCWEDKQGMQGIYLNEEVIAILSEEELKSVLLHELIHYGMIVLGQNYQDGHPDFEAKCVEVGAFTYHKEKTLMNQWKERWLAYKESKTYSVVD